MKRGSILFLRAIIVLVGAGVLAGLLYEPWVEGVNANADFAGVYLDDPFLVYAYLGSVPFFYGLYQAFRLLGYVADGQAISPGTTEALRRIKYSALALIAVIVGGETYIILGVSDDHAGPVMMGFLTSIACLVTAAAAATLERVLQSAVDLKSEHDLTV